MLQEKALLVKLSLSKWSGWKTDKKITNDIAREKNTDSRSIKLNKFLIAKDEINNITTIDGKIRQTHYNYTLPWGYEGVSLLPSELFTTYTSEIGKLRAQREKAVGRLLDRYPELIEEAREKLNGMFNPLDYPSVEVLGGKFGVVVDFAPIPKSDDIRINLSDSEVAEIKKQYENSSNKMLEDAIKNIYQRIENLVSHMVEKLGSSDSIFRDSLVENLKGICQIADKLNITEDENLKGIVAEIEKNLIVNDAQTLRDNEAVRKETKTKAEQLIEKMRQYS